MQIQVLFLHLVFYSRGQTVALQHSFVQELYSLIMFRWVGEANAYKMRYIGSKIKVNQKLKLKIINWDFSPSPPSEHNHKSDYSMIQ